MGDARAILSGVSRARLLLLALVAALAAAPPAAANGDPASDYLITLPVFLPFEQEVSDDRAEELKGLLERAKDEGFEVRVAIIATPRDLGAVPMLYRKPQQYADFLGLELVYYWKGPLLTVMPNGFGYFENRKPAAAEKAALAKVPVPGTTEGDPLATSAEAAVRALAAARGVSLGGGSAEASSTTNRDRVQIVAGVLVLAAIAFGVRSYLSRRRSLADAA
jgi:hypothetical protein